jgi:hypothetical protein
MLSEEARMRLIALVLAAFVITGPAAAQSWKEYNDPTRDFTVLFPTDPQIQNTNFEVADGKRAPARVYTSRANNGIFTVTVADLSNMNLDEKTVIDHAVKQLSAGNEVKVDFPHRIYSVYGRQLSLAGRDGSRSTVAVFDTNGRLYQIEAKVLPGGNDIDLIRFQQSLVFDRKLSNRSEDTIKNIREACKGVVNNPAGLDDPRCQRK